MKFVLSHLVRLYRGVHERKTVQYKAEAEEKQIAASSYADIQAGDIAGCCF